MKVLSISNSTSFKLNSSAISFNFQMPFPICDTEKEKQFKKVRGLACKKHFQSTPIIRKVVQDSHELYLRNSTPCSTSKVRSKLPNSSRKHFENCHNSTWGKGRPFFWFTFKRIHHLFYQQNLGWKTAGSRNNKKKIFKNVFRASNVPWDRPAWQFFSENGLYSHKGSSSNMEFTHERADFCNTREAVSEPGMIPAPSLRWRSQELGQHLSWARWGKQTRGQ